MSKYCKINEVCSYRGERSVCSFESHCGKQMIITNAMRIRSMSDEELAEFICGIIDLGKDKFINGIIMPNYDKDSIKKYLQSEVEE